MQTSRQNFFLFLVFSLGAAIFCATAPPVRAQTIQGSILGEITDPSGGIIPGAEVTVTNLETGFKRLAISNYVGLYEVPHLAPANYSVSVELPGFKRYSRRPVIIEANKQVRIDITLSIGAPSEEVVVEAQTPVITTESGQIGATVDARTMKDMAMGHRIYSAWV